MGPTRPSDLKSGQANLVRHFSELADDIKARYQPSSQETLVDVCVIGGGSGGVGAAMASARGGARTLLIEASSELGGTSTQAWVSNWEPVDGALGLPREIYERMARFPGAVVHAEYTVGGIRQGGDGLPFEPWAYDQVVREMLSAAGCMLWMNSRFTKAESNNGRIERIVAASPRGEQVIRAKTYIDATADAYVCRDAGCETMLGAETRDAFNEPSAPERPERHLNAITLCYRIRNTGTPIAPSDLPPPQRPAAFMQPCPNGDLVVNCVGMMDGTDILDLTPEELKKKAERLVLGHLAWLQREKGFETWKLVGIAPMLGVRETYRVVGEYVLTEHDVRQGLREQKHHDIVAIADHPLDRHGSKSKLEELPGPYGVPFRCLIPKGYSNLLISSRAASFSHIAALSCRLSRTIMTLGYAAGSAAALGEALGIDARDVDPGLLRARLIESGVKLEANKEGHPKGFVRRLGFSILP